VLSGKPAEGQVNSPNPRSPATDLTQASADSLMDPRAPPDSRGQVEALGDEITLAESGEEALAQLDQLLQGYRERPMNAGDKEERRVACDE